VPFLGAVPFDARVVAEGDDGHPTMIARPESETAAAFERIARAIAGALGWQHVATVSAT
jgi:ATP-binding protein involved in chromosome partitioning